MYIKLHKDAFFRQYQDIGYLWQQKEQHNLVVDKNGALFFASLGREAQNVLDICKKLLYQYKDVSLEQLTADFIDFMQNFVPLNMVVLGETIEDVKRREVLFNYDVYSSYQKADKNTSKSITPTEDINKFLTEHFKKHPQLLSLQIEITPHCNLKCVHCYLGCGVSAINAEKGLTLSHLYKVIDEFRELGGLQISFTGGEAMLNKDMPSLLRYARQRDLSISILTNATLLSDELLKVIQETNVTNVQISLYSMLPEVHDAITQVKGSFKKTKNSIERLRASNIPIQLACPVMKENLNSFETVLEWAHKHNLEVKVESQIIARADFSTENLEHRINLKEQRTFIQRTLDNSSIYQNKLLSNAKFVISPDEPVCGAGRYTLCLEAGGDYYPCPGFKLKLGNCKKQTLRDVWENSIELNELRNLTNEAYGKCLKCPSRAYCNLCPGKLYNESGGNMFELSDYFCEVAHINRQIAEEFMAIHKNKNKEITA